MMHRAYLPGGQSQLQNQEYLATNPPKPSHVCAHIHLGSIELLCNAEVEMHRYIVTHPMLNLESVHIQMFMHNSNHQVHSGYVMSLQ